MFEITTPSTVKLDSFSTRQEHHGEALVPAVDLGVTLKGQNRLLDMLHPELRTMLYCALDKRPESEEKQDELDLPVDDLPNIRFSKLKYPLKFEREQKGFKCVVDYGLGGRSNIVLNLCSVKDFNVTPIEGGSVEVKFKISSAADIDEKIIGKLGMQQQHELTITLLPPVDGAGNVVGQELDDEASWPFPGDGADKGGKKAEAPDATDLFVAGAAVAKKAKPKSAAKKPAAKKGGKRG